MSTHKSKLPIIRWAVVLLCTTVFAATGMGMINRALSFTEPPATLHSTSERPQANRDFIGLPDVQTVSIQNVLNSAADIKVTFAITDGTTISTTTDTLPAESMGIYAAPAGFSGSGLIEVNANNPGLGALPTFATNFELSDSGNSAYLGIGFDRPFLHAPARVVNAPSPIFYAIYFPYAVKNNAGATTQFGLQNPATAYANFVITFYLNDGEVINLFTGVLAPNELKAIDLADVSAIPDGSTGSIVIASDQAIAPIYVKTTGPSNLISDYRAGDFAMIGTSLVAPALFKNNNLQTSELCVQNAGSAQTTVNISYSDNVSASAVITPNTTGCLDQGSEGHSAGWSGGAVITSTQPILGVVNVTARSAGNPVGRWSYAIPSQFQLASQAVALPLLFDNYRTFGSVFGWTTTIYVYNPGSSPAVVTPRFTSYPEDFVDCPHTVVIPARSLVAIPQSELPPFMSTSMGYLQSTQPIAAAVSGTSSKPLGITDRHFGYEAAYLDSLIVPQRACDTVRYAFLPLVQN